MYANQIARRGIGSTARTSSLATTATSTLSLIWSRGIDKDNESNVLENTLEAEGIITARYTCKAPYILLISYDTRVTNHREIQQIYYKFMCLDAIDFVQRQ